MPAWGRAAELLSILTVTARRAALAGTTAGMPVSGYTPDTTAVVEGAVVATGACPLAPLLPPPQAAVTASSRAPANAIRLGVIVFLELLQCLDPLLERRMGVEQPVQPGETPLLRRAGQRGLHPK